MQNPVLIIPPNVQNWRRSVILPRQQQQRMYRPSNSRLMMPRSTSGSAGSSSSLSVSPYNGRRPASPATAAAGFLKRTRSGALIRIFKKSVSAPHFTAASRENIEHGSSRMDVEPRDLRHGGVGSVAVSSPLDPIPEEERSTPAST